MANAVIQGTPLVSTDTSSPYTATLPSSILATELLVIVATYDSGETLTTPSGWTLAKNYVGVARTISVYTRTATGSDGASVDFASTGSLDFTAISFRISTNSYTVQSSAGNAGIDPDSLTTSGSNDYLWLAIAAGGSALTADPSSYTAVSNGGTAGFFLRVASRQNTATTENPGTFAGGGANPISLTLAITPPTPIVGNASLLTSVGTIFATGISYGATGTTALLTMTSQILSPTTEIGDRTVWTPINKS